MWENSRFNKAMYFAARAHKGQYMRHDSWAPYAMHFMGVTACAIKYASYCKNINWDLLVCTALLHDTLEDTSVTYAQIKQEFGVEVADGVQALTKNKKLPEEEQMPDCINRILRQPREIAILKMADRLFNLRDRVPGWGADKIAFYRKSSGQILEKLGFANAKLKKDLAKAIAEY